VFVRQLLVQLPGQPAEITRATMASTTSTGTENHRRPGQPRQPQRLSKMVVNSGYLPPLRYRPFRPVDKRRRQLVAGPRPRRWTRRQARPRNVDGGGVGPAGASGSVRAPGGASAGSGTRVCPERPEPVDPAAPIGCPWVQTSGWHARERRRRRTSIGAWKPGPPNGPMIAPAQGSGLSGRGSPSDRRRVGARRPGRDGRPG